MSPKSLPRRTFLRGLGAGLSLPALECFAPARVVRGQSVSQVPLRLAFLYIPNGAHMPHWTPSQEGALRELPHTFAGFGKLRDELLFVSGLRLQGAEAQGDGPGDHARSMAAFLTGAHPRKTDGGDIRNGVSIDQWAASRQKNRCPLPSLELGLEPGKIAGECDSGYSCAYSSNLSWRSETSPVPKDINPRSVFRRILGLEQERDPRVVSEILARRRSILDFVLDDVRSLQPRLGGADRQKLDEYLFAVRDVERRLDVPRTHRIPGDYGPAPSQRPPENYGAYARLMLDLLVLAFRTDATRIATFVFGNEGSNRSYREIEVAEGHHEVSHHDQQPDKLAKIARINRFHADLFRDFLARMRQVSEGDGTLLDRTLILYGSGIEDGNSHAHHDLPIVLAGGRGAGLHPGRHLRVSENTPLANLYVSLINHWGEPLENFADSNGQIADL
ncbi:MAG TPA: DUF1552 domain-containing protein [Pirellulaceae bacterium]